MEGVRCMDKICDYDEGYDREDAYEIGWCYECKCNYECPMKRKILLKELKKIVGDYYG